MLKGPGDPLSLRRIQSSFSMKLAPHEGSGRGILFQGDLAALTRSRARDQQDCLVMGAEPLHSHGQKGGAVCEEDRVSTVAQCGL